MNTGVSPAGERIFVGLGANLGDARAHVDEALAALTKLPQTRCVARSALYCSAPVEAIGPDYVNAVAELRSALPPLELLAALQGIEQAHGRLRPYVNAPRTLDLDLLLFGQRELQLPALSLPHPRMHQRAFVLAPLLEIEPDLVHPRLGPLWPWLAKVADQRLSRMAAA